MEEGMEVGRRLGLKVRLTPGKRGDDVVGTKVGVDNGAAVGCDVGSALGCLDGCPVGMQEG